MKRECIRRLIIVAFVLKDGTPKIIAGKFKFYHNGKNDIITEIKDRYMAISVIIGKLYNVCMGGSIIIDESDTDEFVKKMFLIPDWDKVPIHYVE